ncbi:hypothetical protein ACB092_07G008800 [Castanea dentata]
MIGLGKEHGGLYFLQQDFKQVSVKEGEAKVIMTWIFVY